MPATTKLPVFMRLGAAGPMHEVGSIELPLDGNGWLTFDRGDLAAAFRSVADEIELHGVGEGVPDAAAHG